MSDALVLGGGGVAGIAWITGLLLGLDESGQDVTRAELIVGTSAGSTVAAQLGSDVGLQELYARQFEPELQTPEIMVEMDLESWVAELTAVAQTAARRGGPGGLSRSAVRAFRPGRRSAGRLCRTR